MKKNRILGGVLPIMTALLALVACNKNDFQSDDAPGVGKKIPYTVNVGPTRATVGSDMKTLNFADGDKLYVSGTNISGVLELQTGTGTSSGTFSGELTYTGEGSPAADLALEATLVGAHQTFPIVSVDAGGVVTVHYPNASFCASVSEAVQKFSDLKGTSTYGSKSFTLSQQTAFLNFDITFDDGTAAGTELSAVVSNGGLELSTAAVTTVTDNGVKAKFVLPVAAGTVLSGATVKMGDKDAISFSGATLAGKVYNITKTQTVPGVPTLASVFSDGAVVCVKAYTDNEHYFSVTGTYNAGTGSYSCTGGGDRDVPNRTSMTKNGNFLEAFLSYYFNEISIIFDTTNNTYAVYSTESTSLWRMRGLQSITVNDTDITSSLTLQ